ncbi:MAG TPA: hypothetical protein PLY82_05830 [Methanosarcina thermophila]|nr:hypothetical protein [Methanosarcina thermophila]HPT81045.1 hypothetical protein [Methanosarcina thermophila]
MERRRGFYLQIAAILLVVLQVLPVSVALNHKVENILVDEIEKTNSALTYNGTEQIEQAPENLSEMETALISLNENRAQLNTSLEYMGDMIEVANSIFGEPDSSMSTNANMLKCLETMVEVLG